MPEKYFINNIGLINTQGKDVVDFLGRMSTNDFRKFNDSEFRKTILTTDKGRIVDLINVFFNESSPIIVTSDNFQEKVITHLDKYIIMDDVQLSKPDEHYFRITILSDAEPVELAGKLFGAELSKGKYATLEETDIIYADDFKMKTLNIICRSDRVQYYKDSLKNSPELSPEEFEKLRIDAGIPLGENEFNDQVNPVECGLSEYISFSKGCYIGQEVIARLDSQGKIPKQMVKFNSSAIVKRGEKLLDDEMKESGFVSTVLNDENGTSGLGFIRSVNLDFEKKYFTQTNGTKNLINISKIN